MIDLTGQHVAAPLAAAIGTDNLAAVAEWLRAVASGHALETSGGKVHSPSVSWLAEAVTFYTPDPSHD